MVKLVAIICVLSWAPLSECKKQEGVARREDIPYIKCQVCEKLASEVYALVQKKEALISHKNISEYQIIEIVENVCNLKKEEADWILKIDIVEQGDKLELVDQDVEGMCNSECKTIERACQEVMGYSDTDVAEYIYSRRPQLDSLVNYLCKDLTKACNKKPPAVPKDRVPGEAFVSKPTKEAEMEKMMRSMEGLPGAPGMKMYSRDELMNMQNFGDEDADEDDDDDDAKFRSTVGNAFREKANKNINWKAKVAEYVKDAGKTIKTQATKVSRNLQRLWRSKSKVTRSSQRRWKSSSSSGSKKKSTAKKAEL